MLSLIHLGDSEVKALRIMKHFTQQTILALIALKELYSLHQLNVFSH